MSFQANIPQAATLMSNSQADLLGNFQAIDVFVAAEHYGFGNANAGRHNFNAALAAPTAADATHVGIYAKVSPATGKPELYINKTAEQTPFTASGQTNPGWTYLPSGVLIKWGSATTVHGGNKTVNFDATVPFTAIPFCTVTKRGSAPHQHAIFVQNVNINQLTVYDSGSVNDTFYYIAIGW